MQSGRQGCGWLKLLVKACCGLPPWHGFAGQDRARIREDETALRLE